MLYQSPFKFLDAYSKEDKEIFFGRESEIQKLFDISQETNLILLYGTSGTGKTSLINCGLSNRFEESDWFSLFVQRKSNLIESLNQEIRKAADTEIPQDMEIRIAMRSLFLDYFKPIFLVFDQFEELFILGTEEEQDIFFKYLAEILQVKFQCTVILSMREEYIAHLDKYEPQIPSLFDYKFRLEKMNRVNLEKVILGTTEAHKIQLQDASETMDLMIQNLSDKNERVDLTDLQVYLDRLYRMEAERTMTNENIVFTPGLVKQTGHLEDVLSDFIDEKILELNDEFEKLGYSNEGVPLKVLFSLVTGDGTKQDKRLMKSSSVLEIEIFQREKLDIV